MNNENNLTSAVQDALGQAQQIAINRHQQEIEIAHLFKFLVQPGQLVTDIYKKAGVEVTAFEAKIDEVLDKLPEVSGSVQYGQSFSLKCYSYCGMLTKLNKNLPMNTFHLIR